MADPQKKKNVKEKDPMEGIESVFMIMSFERMKCLVDWYLLSWIVVSFVNLILSHKKE